jgi:hypothetical protein
MTDVRIQNSEFRLVILSVSEGSVQGELDPSVAALPQDDKL